MAYRGGNRRGRPRGVRLTNGRCEFARISSLYRRCIVVGKRMNKKKKKRKKNKFASLRVVRGPVADARPAALEPEVLEGESRVYILLITWYDPRVLSGFLTVYIKTLLFIIY